MKKLLFAAIGLGITYLLNNKAARDKLFSKVRPIVDGFMSKTAK